jgi:Flp pilus assembly protein TadD
VVVTKDGKAFAHGINDLRAMVKVSEVKGLKKTIANLKAKLKRSPNNLELITSLSTTLLASGDLNGAELMARKALDIDFRNKDNKIVLAQAAYLKGQDKVAEGIIQGILNDKTFESSEAFNLTGCIRLNDNDVNGAIVLFNKAIEKNPDNVAALTNLGIVHLRRQNPAEAQEKFKEALKKLPDNPDILMHLGITYAVQGQFEKAEEQYDKVAKAYKTSPILVFNMAILKKRQGRYSEALADLKRYVKLTQGHQVPGEVVVGLMADLTRQLATGETRISDAEIDELVEKSQEKKPAKKRSEKSSGGYTMTGNVGVISDSEY